MGQSIQDGDFRVNGAFSAKSINYPADSIGDSDIEQDAGIQATKVIHQHALHLDQAAGSDVVAQTRLVHTFRGDATLVAVSVVTAVAPTGGDKELTVDVQLGNESTGFATILTAPITVDATHANREVVAGVLDITAAAPGDTLEIIIAVAGSTGSQGQGVCVTVWVRETP